MILSQNLGLKTVAQKPADIYVVEVHNCRKGRLGETSEWLLIERQEHLERDAGGDVASAKLRLQYWSLNDASLQLDAPDGEFVASYHAGQGVSLSSHSMCTGGYILIEPDRLCGLGLGTYFMNNVVEWVSQWPGAKVRPIELPPGEHIATPAQQLRIHFYAKFGIRFIFPEDRPYHGIARPMLVSDLTLAPLPSEAITQHSVVDFLRKTMYERTQFAWEISSLKESLRSNRMALSQATNTPISWAFRRIFLNNPARTACILMAACAVGMSVYHLF